MSSKKPYQRTRGHRPAKGAKKISITFSWIKLDRSQGQSIVQWEEEGLLAVLCEMMRQIGQYDEGQVFAEQMVKQYTKVGFPPDSRFDEPRHVSPANWAVIHIKPRSKEVVVGYVEESVFYIVFLDKEHEFWPTMDIQDRGKKKR